MMLELESLSTVSTLEPPQNGRFVMADHVPLETVDVGELLLAHATVLELLRS